MEGSTWYGYVPSDWNVDRFKRIATIRNGQVDPEDDRYKDLPLFAPNHIESGTGRLLEVESADAQGAESGKFLVEPGEVVYSKIRPELRKVIVAPFKGLCSADMYPVRPAYRVEARFLYYEMLSDGFSQYTLLESDRVAMPKINRKALGECIFVYPDRKQQARICEYLDSSCAAIDAAVAAKRRQIETLDALRHSTIHRAVTRGIDECPKLKESGLEWLGSIPSHWAIRRIKDIAELRSGDALAPEDIAPEGDYPVFGGNGLRGYAASFTHDGHYVLIGRQGALCGNINYANGKFWATEHAVVATLLKKIDTKWFGELLRTMNLNQYSIAAAQPGLAVEKIKFLRLPVPPLEEQTRIADHVKAFILRIESMASQLGKQIATLTAYRKSLIHECVTGQRRISEADVTAAQRVEPSLSKLRQI